MHSIIEIYDNYKDLGINTRKITMGEEIEMVMDFIDYKKNKFKPTYNKQLAIFIETKINNSYPDIVFVEYNPLAFENWTHSRDDLTIHDLKILHHIYTNIRISTNDIMEHLGINRSKLFFTIENLLNAKLIDIGNGKWFINDKNAFGVKKVEAVEAKIQKWDEVFQQALLNKNFASESYILSKVDNEPRKETLDRFDKFGIGVYVFNKKGFSRINKSVKTNFPCSYTSICFNEWVGKILNNKRKEMIHFV